MSGQSCQTGLGFDWSSPERHSNSLLVHRGDRTCLLEPVHFVQISNLSVLSRPSGRTSLMMHDALNQRGQRGNTTSYQSQPECSISAVHTVALYPVVQTNASWFRSLHLTHSLFSSLGSHPILCKKLMPNPFQGALSLSEHPRFYPSSRILMRLTEKVQRAVDGVKILLDIAKESSDAFPPLKSALGCVSALINHYEVRS